MYLGYEYCLAIQMLYVLILLPIVPPWKPCYFMRCRHHWHHLE